MEITADFKIADPTKRTWAGVFGHRPDNSTQLKLQGEMFAVMSIKAEINFDLPNLASLLQDELQSMYFTPNPNPAKLQDFEEALLAVNKRIAQIMEREPDLAKKGVDFEMLVAVVREGTMYLGVVGESKVMVARGDDVAEIGGVLIDSEMDGFARTGSVKLEPNDRILLLTSDAFKQIDESGGETSLQEFSIKQNKLSKGALVLVGYNLDDEWLTAPAQEDVEEEVEEKPEDIVPTQEEMDQIIDDYEHDDLPLEDEDEEFESVEDDQPELPSGPGRAEQLKSGLMGAVAAARAKLARNRTPKSANMAEEDPLDVMAHSPDRLADVKSSIKDFATRSQEAIRSIRHGKPGSRDSYVKGGRRPGLYIPPKWRIVGVVMFIALVIVVFGIRQTIQDNERRAFEQGVMDQIAEYEQELERLTIRANTAGIGTGQEAEKENILQEFEQLAADAEALKPEGVGVSDLDRIITEVHTEEDTLLKVNAFTQPQLITDLAVNFQNVDAVDIEYSEGQLYVADKSRSVIYRTTTNIQSEANNFVTGLASPKLLSVDPNGDLVFVDSGSDSVIGTVDIADGSVRRQPGMAASRIGNLSAMFVWTNNGSLYSINTDKKAIVRQSSVAGNYQIPGDGSVWRTDGDFANAIDLAVDGSIYVLVKGKGLLRYFGGQPAQLVLAGLLSSDVDALKNATAFELTSNRIYIADAANKRVLVFSLRTGTEPIFDFTEQIVYRGSDNIFSDIRDIVVVPGQQSERLFVLDGPRIIRVDR